MRAPSGPSVNTKAVEKAQLRAHSDKPSVHTRVGRPPFQGAGPRTAGGVKAGRQAPILTSICFGFASSAFGTVTVSTPLR